MNVTRIGLDRPGRRVHSAPAMFAVLAMISAIGFCDVSDAHAATQPRFALPREAVHALFVAIRDHDDVRVAAILGAPKNEFCCSDAAQDARERARFVAKYRQMRRLVKEPDGATVLYVGAENWPFPYPLVESKGRWRFDTAAGQREIVFRRIGENETAAIATCRNFVKAHGAQAEIQPGGAQLMHGYYVKNIGAGNRKAGINGDNGARSVYVAYPEKYRATGVLTFCVTPDGTVYAKDLGRNTVNRAESLTGSRPDSTWRVEK